MINSYKFGNMEIDGNSYTKDVIILPDGSVISPWWRREGHVVALEDLDNITETHPTKLIIGMGNPGYMKPAPGLIDKLKQQGINATLLPTEQAVKQFNALSRESGSVAACFHLTC